MKEFDIQFIERPGEESINVYTAHLNKLGFKIFIYEKTNKQYPQIIQMQNKYKGQNIHEIKEYLVPREAIIHDK